MRVLIADDSRLAGERLSLKESIEQTHQVEVVDRALDVLQTLAALREFRPDALILDLGMPGESGPDVLRRVKQEDFQRILEVLRRLATSLPQIQ